MSRQWYHISILWHQLRHRSYFVRDLGVEKSYFVNLSYPSPSAKTVHIKKGGWEDRQVRTVDISSLFVQSYSRCTARSFLQSELSCHSAIMSHTLDSPSLKKNNLCICLKSVSCCLAIFGCCFKAHSRDAILRGTTTCLVKSRTGGSLVSQNWVAELQLYELRPGSFSHDVPIKWI